MAHHQQSKGIGTHPKATSAKESAVQSENSLLRFIDDFLAKGAFNSPHRPATSVAELEVESLTKLELEDPDR